MATVETPRKAPPKAPPLSKAERRAKQEADRARKEAEKAEGNVKAGAPKGAPSKGTASGGSSSQLQQQKPHKIAEATRLSHVSKEASITTQESAAQQTRGLRIFSHFGIPRDTKTLKLKGTTIHPAIVRLGLQYSEFKIVGANARCIAMLNTFKIVIRDYETPSDQAMSRDLTTYLSPQINHLVTARPLAVSMGNAIRFLKVEISVLDPSLPEQDAKELLCEKIDHYIRDNITMADKIIQDVSADKIRDNDVILTYARSSVVETVLLRAHSLGKRFSVIVVDSRPLLEGKQLLSTLADAGIECTYLLLTALASVIQEVSLVLLGAHSVQSDGAVYSRAGTALVAMMAKSHSVPTLVCCETYKFSEAVYLDSFSKNELAPSIGPFSYSTVQNPQKLASSEQHDLRVLNPLYDLTPPSNITAIVTEVGTIPPNSVSSLPGALGRGVSG